MHSRNRSFDLPIRFFLCTLQAAVNLLRGSASGVVVAGGFASFLLRELTFRDERAATSAIKLGVIGLLAKLITARLDEGCGRHDACIRKSVWSVRSLHLNHSQGYGHVFRSFFYTRIIE